MIDADLARGQMAVSLAFHIVFASVGVAMPTLMVVAEALWLRTKEQEYLDLARAWAKGTAVLFAVGAVSGTVLSFELGLLFPGFMARAGPLVGPGFALEGLAFFTEAIFLGVYLYGWQRVRPRLHLAAGVVVAVSGLSSAAIVTLTNAWMQLPRGFRIDPETGAWLDLDPGKALLNPYAIHELLHSLPAYYMAAGLTAAGVHAFALLRAGRRGGPRAEGSGFHRKAMSIALTVAVPATLVMPLTGHLAGERVAEFQPMKLAAMESQYRTQRGAPLRIGGIPDALGRKTDYAIEIPRGLSLLATGRSDGLVLGLEEFPEEDWPNPIVHFGFQVMVAIGTALAALTLWAGVMRWRRGAWPDARWFLWAVVASGPLAYLALQAGWVVAEVGRQPWVVYGVLRTRETVTPMPNMIVPFLTFTLVYVGLSAAVAFVLRRIFGASPGLAPRPPQPPTTVTSPREKVEVRS